jgi:3-hydroxyisobutyrate dehydrogenase-like beta-hydroxyacid dehydrogenase
MSVETASRGDRSASIEVGFVGLGAMGSAMAANLLKAGHALAVHNRTPERTAPLVAQGARHAASPSDAAEGEIVITMLADDRALEDVVFGPKGLLEALPAGAIHVSMSTISMALAERLEAAHAAKGQGFISAPVFGRPEAAAQAKLFIVVAGDDGHVQRSLPVLEALGQRCFVIGREPHKANIVKLAGNFLITSVLEALGEAFALTAKAGIDRKEFLTLLTSTLFDAPVYKTYGGIIAEERYQPAGFKASLGHKDIRLVLAAAEALKVPMPLASLVATRFLSLLAQGGGDLDWAAIAKLAARDAGEGASLAPAR